MVTRRRCCPIPVTVIEMLGSAEGSNPSRFATARASLVARPWSGIHTTPARLAASAARWIRFARAYHAPTSVAKPVKASSGSRRSAQRMRA